MSTYAALLSTYISDSHEKLSRCLESILTQNMKLNEVVLVQDGPISKEVGRVIEQYSEIFNQQGIQFKSVSLKVNKGLPAALNEGLLATNSEWIYRIDSDDICLPDRFKKQSEVQKKTNADILGGRIIEFSKYSNNRPELTTERCISTGFIHDQYGHIIKNPMNHMTVMYRKKDILKLGGYKEFKGFEDYELWIRAINNGFKLYNIDSVLCHVDKEGLIQRRSGWNYVKYEITFYSYCARNYKGSFLFLLVGILRACTRILPKSIITNLYQAACRKKQA